MKVKLSIFQVRLICHVITGGDPDQRALELQVIDESIRQKLKMFSDQFTLILIAVVNGHYGGHRWKYSQQAKVELKDHFIGSRKRETEREREREKERHSQTYTQADRE